MARVSRYPAHVPLNVRCRGAQRAERRWGRHLHVAEGAVCSTTIHSDGGGVGSSSTWTRRPGGGSMDGRASAHRTVSHAALKPRTRRPPVTTSVRSHADMPHARPCLRRSLERAAYGYGSMVGGGSAVSAVVGATTVALPPRGGFQGELPCVQHPSCRMHTLTHTTHTS
jgi:hypothetical protein